MSRALNGGRESTPNFATSPFIQYIAPRLGTLTGRLVKGLQWLIIAQVSDGRRLSDEMTGGMNGQPALKEFVSGKGTRSSSCDPWSTSGILHRLAVNLGGQRPENPILKKNNPGIDPAG